MSVEQSAPPYMGKAEVDLKHPEAEARLERIHETIRKVGVSSTVARYPGRVIVFYGLENTEEYDHRKGPGVRQLDFETASV